MFLVPSPPLSPSLAPLVVRVGDSRSASVPDDADFSVVDLDEPRRLVLDERVPGGVHQVRHPVNGQAALLKHRRRRRRRRGGQSCGGIDRPSTLTRLTSPRAFEKGGLTTARRRSRCPRRLECGQKYGGVSRGGGRSVSFVFDELDLREELLI